MKRKQKTAGKTAKRNGGAQGAANAKKTWLDNRRDGEGRYYHRAPDGSRFYGTAEEVRAASLMPWRRNMLADNLRFIRSYADRYAKREELAAWAMQKRRDAIQQGAHDANSPQPINVDAESMMLLEAGARLVADSFEEYVAELVRREIESLVDFAESKTGKREIPLTRHERAALDKIRATRQQIEARRATA